MSTAQLQDVTSTFSHLMSPWHTPRACAWATACSSWQEIQSCTAQLHYCVLGVVGGKLQAAGIARAVQVAMRVHADLRC